MRPPARLRPGGAAAAPVLSGRGAARLWPGRDGACLSRAWGRLIPFARRRVRASAALPRAVGCALAACVLALPAAPALADARFLGEWACRSDHAELETGRRVSGFTRSFRLIVLADGTFLAEGRQSGYGTFRSFGAWQVRGGTFTARGEERGGLGPGLFTLMLKATSEGTLLDVWERKDSRGRVAARTADSCVRG